MAKRIIVNGAKGKMGALASLTLEKEPDFVLVAKLLRTDDLSAAIQETKAEIVVDLTRADCVYENTRTIIEAGAHPVIGTTGLLESQISELQALAAKKNISGLIIPNFSLCAVLMMECAARVAQFLSEVEIIETHHPQKAEAPSGTAIKTALMIAKARKASKAPAVSKELIPGARGRLCEEIPIHSIRLSGFLASQQVIFGSAGEHLTITHNNIDRSAYMPGLILACRKVSSLTHLCYGLEHVL